MKRKTLDLLYKVTVRSVIDYALPIYGNNLKITDLNRLEQLQYNAAKLVTDTLNFTSRDKLNEELGWETIKKRIDYLGLNIFHKIHVKETRPLLFNKMLNNSPPLIFNETTIDRVNLHKHLGIFLTSY